MRIFTGLILAVIFNSALGMGEGTYFNIGNGAEIRADLGSFDVYAGRINYDDYTTRVGVAYKFYKTSDSYLAIGGGGTTARHQFNAVDGFIESHDTDVIPFVQIDAAKGLFFMQVFYSDTDFTTRRTKVISHKPLKLEHRVDSHTGPGLGLFVGFRIPLG